MLACGEEDDDILNGGVRGIFGAGLLSFSFSFSFSTGGYSTSFLIPSTIYESFTLVGKLNPGTLTSFKLCSGSLFVVTVELSLTSCLIFKFCGSLC